MTSSFLVGDFSANGQPEGPGRRDQAYTPTRPDALPPGTRLDEYEIGPLLSESPLGLVYLATDHSLGRKVAIREYLPSALSGRGDGPLVALRAANMADAYRRGLRAFVEEARLLARFDDPSLLRVLRFWEAHFTAYIVMPFYDAPTLTAARERLDMPPAEPWIRSLLESLSNALELLHGESCLHRNVTPDRILMLRDGRPMLLGPSAVRQVLGRAAHTTLIQPGFSAIEEYAESSDLPQGPWTDVYAIGALARFCILGIPPVAATVRSVRDPLVGMQDALFPLRVQWPELDYSRSLLNAIDHALAVDPAQRPQSMGEFRALLNETRPAAAPRGRAQGAPVAPASRAAPAVPERPVDPPAVRPVHDPVDLPVDLPFDPTRTEPDLNLLSASQLETDDFEANLAAMVDAALIDAPPLRNRMPPPSEAGRPPVAPATGLPVAAATDEASIVRAAMAGPTAPATARPSPVPSVAPAPPASPPRADTGLPGRPRAGAPVAPTPGVDMPMRNAPGVDLPIDPADTDHVFTDHAFADPAFAAPPFEDHGADRAALGSLTPAAGRPRWQRRLTAVAAVLLIGAFGYVGWTQYQRVQDEDRIAGRVPVTALPGVASAAPPGATPGPTAAAPVDPIAEARLHPPAAGTAVAPAARSGTGVDSVDPATATAADPGTAPSAALQGSTSPSATGDNGASRSTAAQAAVDPAPMTSPATASAGPGDTASDTAAGSAAESRPARTARLARAAQREARAEHASAAPAAPRAVCGARSDFALYYCMKTQCDKPQNAGHAQCREFKLEQ